jgi:HEAT repeats
MLKIRGLAIAMLLASISACGETEYTDVEDALLALESGGRHARIQAARHIAGERPEDPDGSVVRALARAIEDEEPWVRRWVAAALGNDSLDATIAVPALVRLLDEEEVPAIRVAAVHAVGRHAPHAAPAVAALVHIVAEEDDLIREMASWALGEIGIPAREAARAVLDRMTAKGRDRLLISLPMVTGAEKQKYAHDEELVSVCVDSQPSIVIKRRGYTLSNLVDGLRASAGTKRSDVDPYASEIFAELAIDEDLPWVAAQAVLGVLSHPYVRIAKVELAVRRTEDRHDTGMIRVHLRRESDPDPVIVLALPGPSRGGLEERLQKLIERDRGAYVLLHPGPSVPTRRVLEVIAMLHRQGFWVHLEVFSQGPVLSDSWRWRHDLFEKSDDADPAPLLPRLVEGARGAPGDGYEWTEVVR